MNEILRCPYCSFPVSGEAVKLWDARTYCRKCVAEVSPELYDVAITHSRLEDTVNRQDIRAIHFIAFIGKWYLFTILLLFGLPFGLLFLAGKVELLPLVIVLLFFGGFGVLFLSLQSALGAFVHRWQLPRTVTVEDGQLLIVGPKKKTSVPITQCKWYFGSTAIDQLYMFSRLRRGIVIQTPDAQVVVGYSQGMLGHWRAFLLLTRIPQNPPLGCLRLIGVAGIGMIVGILVGSGIGWIISLITNNSDWTPVIGFMGVIEGPVVALMYASRTSDGVAAARKRLHPALIGLAFLAIGMKFGIFGGLPGALVCGSINAGFGALVGWYCRAKIRSTELDDQIMRQHRR